MRKVAVGERFYNIPPPLPEGAEFNFTKAGFTLAVRWNDVSDQDVKEFKESFKFTVVTKLPVILLMYRWGNHPWSDAPFDWHLNPPEDRAFPPALIGENEGVLFTVFLLEARTGVIKAIKGKSLPHDASKILCRSIQEQMDSNYSPRDFKERLEELYADPRLFELADMTSEKATELRKKAEQEMQ